MRLKRRHLTLPRMDVTPLADVIFLLLIFFMLSSTFIVQPGIKVKLPETTTAKVTPEDKITITVNRQGKIFLNRDKVELAELERRLGVLLSATPNRAVMIAADDKVYHGLVVSVLDQARRAGAQHLAIATEQKVPGPLDKKDSKK